MKAQQTQLWISNFKHGAEQTREVALASICLVLDLLTCQNVFDSLLALRELKKWSHPQRYVQFITGKDFLTFIHLHQNEYNIIMLQNFKLPLIKFIIFSSSTMEKLEEIAFKTAYQEVIFNLLLSPKHLSLKAKKLSFSCGIASSSLISLNPYLTSEQVIKFVRERLDFFLVGTMNDLVKKKMISKFLEDMAEIVQKISRKSNHKELPDIWVFFWRNFGWKDYLSEATSTRSTICSWKMENVWSYGISFTISWRYHLWFWTIVESKSSNPWSGQIFYTIIVSAEVLNQLNTCPSCLLLRWFLLNFIEWTRKCMS